MTTANASARTPVVDVQIHNELMNANELQLNANGDAYDLFSDFRARRDERAYTMLNNASVYVVLQHASGHYSVDVVRAVQLDCVAAQLSIDVARRTDAK